MGYQCPRCGGSVKRDSSSSAWFLGGLIGAMLTAAFGGFVCAKCGKLRGDEFAPEVRSKMRTGSIALGITAVVVLAGLVWVLITIRP